MKRVIAIAIFCLTQAICASSHGNLDSYEVAQIYKAVEMDRGSKSIDNYGNIKEAKTILVPTKMDEGKYSVELTRIDSNFYKIEGTSYYIETRYCYEYAYRDDAVLIIESNYSSTVSIRSATS